MRLRAVQRSVQRGAVHGVFGRETFPGGTILHWDADIGAFSEQTGGVHTFNHAVLSPQYQLNADGSYSNVGAKPAVDVFDGEKWLRSCGAVTNLALVTPSLTNATFIGNAFNPTSVNSVHILNLLPDNGISVPYFVSATLKSNGVRYAKFVQYNRWQNFDLQDGVLSGTSGWTDATIEDLGGGYYRCSAIVIPSVSQRVYVTLSPNNTAHWDDTYLGDPTKGIIVRDYQVSQVAYPVPYVPPGVTQPASNATATNGSWFSLPDGSELWQALDGQPDGVELITNGGFADDIDGWSTGTPNTTCEWASGEAKSTRIGDAAVDAGVIYCDAATTPGRYKIEFDAYSNDVSIVLNVGLGDGVIIRNYAYSEIGPITSVKKRYFVFVTTTAGYSKFSVNSKLDNFTTGASIYLDNISIQRIQPQPLTLATRVRMGVGSGDLPNGGDFTVAAASHVLYTQHMYSAWSGNKRIVTAYDGVTSATITLDWPRNSIIRRVTQVNTAGTQFRVGYMIEGTHTTIQWSTWTNYDSSFNPSTIYRLMLGYNNPYPMWFNKITAWKKQVTDAEILEAMA